LVLSCLEDPSDPWVQYRPERLWCRWIQWVQLDPSRQYVPQCLLLLLDPFIHLGLLVLFHQSCRSIQLRQLVHLTPLHPRVPWDQSFLLGLLVQ
jgi:hypothetical protein